MVTKGIIKSIDIKGNTCIIRIPSFETAGDNEFIATATVSNTPGSYNGYKVNDVVWVAFEDNQFECPVIIGKLYLGIDAEKADPRGTLNVEDSKVSRSAEIPFDTKLGNDIETNMPKTLAPFTSLSNIAGTLSQAEMNIAQNDRDYGNRFKQTSEAINAQGDKLSSTIEQTAKDIRAEVSEVNDSKLDKKSDGSEYSDPDTLIKTGLGWDLNKDSWTIKAFDQTEGHTIPDEGLDIFKITRTSVDINTPFVRMTGYPHTVTVRFASSISKTVYPNLYMSEEPSVNNINIEAWSTVEPAWEDGKYIWQWTQSIKYKYSENNQGEAVWDTEIDDRVVCLAGASAASYWLKISSDFHNGAQQNQDIIITAMMKVGTGEEREDSNAVLSYDWFGAAEKVKTNESTEQHKLIFKAPNTDSEGNLTGLFPNTKLLITATRNGVDYATKTIEYRPIDTPILTLDKESVVFEYNSYGDIKLSPNQVTVKALASLNNEEIINVNYAWEYDENECTCIVNNTKSNEIIITGIAEEVDVTTITCKATYKDNLDTDIVLNKSFTVIKNKQGKSLYKLDIENHFVTFNVGYDVTSIKVPTEESATDIYDIINRTTHKVSAFYGDDPISFELTNINPSTDDDIDEANKEFRLFKESTSVTEKIYDDSDINNHVYTNYITELSTLNGNIIYKLYRGKTMVAASKFEASLLPKGDPTANYWLRSSASKIETDHYGIISDVYFNNTTGIGKKAITFNVIRKSGLETPEYTIVDENTNNLKIIINKDGTEYSYEGYIADMLDIDTTDTTDNSDWSTSLYNPINNQKNYTLPISIEEKEVKNFITIQLFDTEVLIDELFIETIATGMPATSYDLKISQAFHLGTNNEKDIVIIPYKKFGTEAETVDSNAYIRYTWAGDDESAPTWENTSELTIKASDIQAKDLIVEAAHKYIQDDEEYYEIYKQEIVVYSPVNIPVLNLSPDSANIYYNPEVDSNTNEWGKIKGQDLVVVTASVLKGGSSISSGINYKWSLKNCNNTDLEIINNNDEIITIASCLSNEIRISEVFKNEVILTCTATLSEKDESGKHIEISRDFKIYREVNTAEYKLRISTPIHTGTAQMSEINVNAVVKIGSNQESADPNVYLRYKWDGEDWTNWSKTSEITFIPKKINASGIEFKDTNLIVQASRTGKDGSEYETETITYSPQNTPIIDLTNDTASIAYDVEGNKIEDDDFVVSTAKVWLAGKPVPTSDYTYSWTLSKCDAKNGTQDHKIEINKLDATTATATFQVIFKANTAYAGLKLEKEFTISKQLKGDSTINYWLAPSHNNIIRDNNTASWYPNDIYVDVIKQYGIKPAETLDLSEAGVSNNFKLKIEVDNTELNLTTEENKDILTITEYGQYKVSLKSAPTSKLSLTLYTIEHTIDNNIIEHFAYCVNIGVVKDGSSNYSLDIFNDFISIPADENGDCYATYDWSLTEHSIKAYYGDTLLTIESISDKTPTNPDINKYYLKYTASNIVFAADYPKLSTDNKTAEIKLADSIQLENSEDIKYTTVPNQINYELYKGISKAASGKFELSKLNDGIKATSYWITTTSPVHKGTNQQSPIEVTAWSKHGDESTQVNNELFIRYAWRSADGKFSDFKNEDLNKNALMGSITINNFVDADLCIQTSYKDDFSIINDTEIITYAPAGTPILDLENDYATLSYYYHVDDKQIKKINSEETVSTTAKVYLDGNEITANVKYEWTCSDTDASCDATDNSIIVSEIKDDHADFTCTATLSDKSLFKEDIVLTKVFTVAKQVKGDPSISYWLKTSAPVHIGTKQSEAIVVTAMHKIGEGTEGVNESAILFYKFDKETSWNKVPGRVVGEGEDAKTYYDTFDSSTISEFKFKDSDLLIKATHDTTLTTGNINAVENKDKIFDEETITYSPLNTPVLDLDNEIDDLSYSADGTTLLDTTSVVSTATLFLNGKALPDTEQDDSTIELVSYEWEIKEGSGSCEYTLSNNYKTITITKFADSENKNKSELICTATYKGEKYTKILTINKKLKGDNAIYYAIKPEHSNIVYNTEGNTWNPEKLKVNFYIYDGSIASLFDSCKITYTIDSDSAVTTTCSSGTLELDSSKISSQVSISLYDANKETIVDTEVIKVLDAAEAPYTIDIFNERVTAITNTGKLDYSEDSGTWWESMTTHKIKIFRGGTLIDLNDEDSVAISDSLDESENGKYYQLVRTKNNIKEIIEVEDNSNNTLKTYYITGLTKNDEANPNDSGTITYDLYANKNLVATAVFEFKKITTGISITGVTNKYYATKTDTLTNEDKAKEWFDDINKSGYGPETPYLWNYEIINYSSGEPTITPIALLGSRGKGIKAISEYYLLNNTASTPTKPTKENVGNWQTGKSAPTKPTAELPYFWNSEKIEYTDGDVEFTDPALIGTYSRSIKEVKNYYYATTSESVTLPAKGDTAWKTTIGESGAKFNATNKYLWNYEEIIYDRALTDGSNNKSKTTDIELISIWSKEIDHIEEFYLISKSMDRSKSEGATEYIFETEENREDVWSTTLKTPTSEHPYLWNKETTYYTDGTNESTNPIILSTFARSITGVQNFYLATKKDDNKDDPLDNDPAKDKDEKVIGWKESINEAGFDAINKYLWNYEEITYDLPFGTDDDGNPINTSKTEPEIISTWSKSIDYIDELYLISESSGSDYYDKKFADWDSEVVSPNSSYPYLWNKETTYFTDGTSETTEPIIIGTYGETFGFNIITTASSIIKDENVTPTKFTPNEFTIKFNEVSGSDVISCHKSKRNYKFSIQQIVEGSVKDAFAEDTLKNKSVANGDPADTNYDNGFSFNISDRSAYTDPNDQKIYSVEGFLITLYFQTSSGEYIAAKTETIPIQKTGINATSYWISLGANTHLGTQQKTEISVRAMKKVGSELEEFDNSAYLWWYDNSAKTWKAGSEIGQLNFNISKINNNIGNDNLRILATHIASFDAESLNNNPDSAVIQPEVYDYEVIDYAPLNTPILILNNDADYLSYDATGSTKLDAKSVSSTATLTRNDEEIANTAYVWKLTDCTSADTASDNSMHLYNKTVKISEIVTNKNSGTATCCAFNKLYEISAIVNRNNWTEAEFIKYAPGGIGVEDGEEQWTSTTAIEEGKYFVVLGKATDTGNTWVLWYESLGTGTDGQLNGKPIVSDKYKEKDFSIIKQRQGNNGDSIIKTSKQYLLLKDLKYSNVRFKDGIFEGYIEGSKLWEEITEDTHYNLFTEDFQADLFKEYDSDRHKIFVREEYTYSSGTITYSEFREEKVVEEVFALKQGKSTNYYGPVDPAGTEGSLTYGDNMIKGDCWFDTDNYGYELDPEYTSFTTVEDYIDYYLANRDANSEIMSYVEVTATNLQTVIDTRGITVGEEAYKKVLQPTLKQWSVLATHEDGSSTYGWTDVGGETIENKVTANYINAMDITAKRIEILNTDHTTLFKADGLNNKHEVEIAGFKVGPLNSSAKGLYIPTKNTDTTASGVTQYGVGLGTSSGSEDPVFWAGYNGAKKNLSGGNYIYNNDYSAKQPYEANGGWQENTNCYITTAGKLVAKNIEATGGKIAGFDIDSTTISKGTIGEDGSVFVSTGKTATTNIGSSAGEKTWAFTAGNDFGVTTNGTIYANRIILGDKYQTLEDKEDGDLGGNISALSAQISAASADITTIKSDYITTEKLNAVSAKIDEINTDNIRVPINDGDPNNDEDLIFKADGRKKDENGELINDNKRVKIGGFTVTNQSLELRDVDNQITSISSNTATWSLPDIFDAIDKDGNKLYPQHFSKHYNQTYYLDQNSICFSTWNNTNQKICVAKVIFNKKVDNYLLYYRLGNILTLENEEYDCGKFIISKKNATYVPTTTDSDQVQHYLQESYSGAANNIDSFSEIELCDINKGDFYYLVFIPGENDLTNLDERLYPTAYFVMSKDNTLITAGDKFNVFSDGTIRSEAGALGGLILEENKLYNLSQDPTAEGGNIGVGIGSCDASNSYAFWAGAQDGLNTYDSWLGKNAPFRVDYNGNLFSSSGTFGKLKLDNIGLTVQQNWNWISERTYSNYYYHLGTKIDFELNSTDASMKWVTSTKYTHTNLDLTDEDKQNLETKTRVTELNNDYLNIPKTYSESAYIKYLHDLNTRTQILKITSDDSSNNYYQVKITLTLKDSNVFNTKTHAVATLELLDAEGNSTNVFNEKETYISALFAHRKNNGTGYDYEDTTTFEQVLLNNPNSISQINVVKPAKYGLAGRWVNYVQFKVTYSGQVYKFELGNTSWDYELTESKTYTQAIKYPTNSTKYFISPSVSYNTEKGVILGSDDNYFHSAYFNTIHCDTIYRNNEQSDLRIKNSIEELSDKYELFFDALKPVRYKYNNGTSGRYHVGFIAQDVVKNLENANLDTTQFAGVALSNPGTDSEKWYLYKEDFAPINTWQIQKLKKRVSEQETTIKLLEERIKALEEKQ